MGRRYFNCSMCARVTSLDTNTWVGDGVIFCGQCGRHVRKHVVIGSEELHLFGERYGWDATIGEVMDRETQRHQGKESHGHKGTDVQKAE